ncbi:PadR family transcriptional regulator [Lentibacillus saliphilus]|uniref:PadR family transcriptional regulator n=1 Tax=Lentibacillus saliphilus TaxID=2737028 RepID=UPI001C305BED|nr:PadR family transcriptional regulator [Lentibacillus saliphilus]
MENRLRELRQSMENSTFKSISFSEELRQRVHEGIRKQKETDESISLAVLQILMNATTGFDLTQLLTSRGIQAFHQNEGALYTLLHRLEQDGYLNAYWDDSGVKFYQTSGKGKALLLRAEKKTQRKGFVLKERFEG